MSGGCCECEHPDLMIEPVPTFWKEMLTLVGMLKDMIKDRPKPKNKWREPDEVGILEEFETTINKFLVYLDQQLNGVKVNQKLFEDLTTIAKEVFMGSGGPDYNGWYFRLFHNPKRALEEKPEVGTCFTGIDDDRGPGGVVHLGTGLPQLMYILINDSRSGEQKVFLGPAYTSYEVVTDYNTRYNDEEWKNAHKKFKNLF